MEAATQMNSDLKPIRQYKENAWVEDVHWHYFTPHIFAAANRDRSVIIYDIREKDQGDKPLMTILAHGLEVNSVNFNPFIEYLFLTASSDKTVALWDMRNML